jgi:hypothetical protein
MFFVELVKVEGDWLWCSDRIGCKPEHVPGCMDEFVVKKVKGRMGSIGGEMVPTTLCGSLL